MKTNECPHNILLVLCIHIENDRDGQRPVLIGGEVNPQAPFTSACQVRVYSGKGSGQVRTETDEGEGQRLDKGLVRPELGPM